MRIIFDDFMDRGETVDRIFMRITIIDSILYDGGFNPLLTWYYLFSGRRGITRHR